MLLYVHTPFCRKKCPYCAFVSTVYNQADMDDFVGALLAEIRFWGERLEEKSVSTLFFGGGTPSLLPPGGLSMILNQAVKSFTLAPDLELSLEGNPESLGNPEYLASLKSLGVNRLSMGVQSFNDANLKTLGRIHSVRDAVRAFQMARNAGFANINMDLIWGLPSQRLKLWLDELRQAVALGPEHLSCYGLTVEPGTELERLCLSRALTLPQEDEQSKMFVYGSDYLESQGYIHYEVSNFARMGYQCRHNMGYWEGQDYLGLGPSAVSTIQGRRWENPPDLQDYAGAVRQGKLGCEAEELGPTEKARELVMLSLRTTRGLRLRDYKKLTGRDFLKEHEALVHALHKNELLRIRQGHVRLTKPGLLVSNTILEHFFT